MHRLRLIAVGFALAALVALSGLLGSGQTVRADTLPHAASGFDFKKSASGPPVCSEFGFASSAYWLKAGDCGFVSFQVSNTDYATSTVIVRLLGPNGALLQQSLAHQYTSPTDGTTSWLAAINPATTWPSGRIDAEVNVLHDPTPAGHGYFYVNHLDTPVNIAASPDGVHMPGDPVVVSGKISQVTTVAGATQVLQGVKAKYFLQVVGPNNLTKGPFGPYLAGSDGAFSQVLPRWATQDFVAGPDTDYKTTVSVQVINATYTDPLTGAWVGEQAGEAPVTLLSPPDRLVLENNFISSVGWVKPGDTYPFRILVKNFMRNAVSGATVTIPAPDGTTFTSVSPNPGNGTASISNGSIVWTLPTVPASVNGNPSVLTLVAQAKADTLGQDPQIVWKNLSSTASLTYATAPATVTSVSKGPKVIPIDEAYDTARYGYRPFPVVPVDYFERKHDPAHTAEHLSSVINSPDIEGSTYNLYQEMSFGQLYPNADVPSAGITTATWDVNWSSPRYQQSGFQFSQVDIPDPAGACFGNTFTSLIDTPIYSERIRDGWYQLPGDTNYYGDDQFTGGGSQAGARTGVAALFQIDNACGPTPKAVFDAAHIADPDINYSDFDSDKDGVVDFFMLVFPGLGGNGESLTNGYDNIWPHSSSLEFGFTDAITGQPGYVSDDQLIDLQGRPLYYTDSSRTAMTTNVTTTPVYVRVGPYNVNPESAIEHASVISHEYGHSLGLPDFYSHGNRTTYGDWNLMATDKSQNTDIFGKQELGWVVPRVLPPGETTVSDWHDSKYNTHRIDWMQPDGTPYSLTGPAVNNGEGYVVKLPGRQIIDPAVVAAGASPSHVWWSGHQNGSGCTPLGAHNMDIALPELANVPAGTPIKVTFNSNWSAEWDYDYGFVMTSTDGGNTYTSVASENGYTTPMAQNPTANGCQARYGNGLTGTSTSHQAGTQAVDRVVGTYEPGVFLPDSYDISSAAGHATVLRFSYATDPAIAKNGWFIDDVKVTAGDQVIYDSDFEDGANDMRIYNGGCREGLHTAPICTKGWQFVAASEDSRADHAYYMEMRDRSGFDFDSHGQNDREALAFEPGLLLVYTDEQHGYGNFGTDDPPAQSPVDSAPQTGNSAPNLNDAAFTSLAGRNHYSDAGAGWTDNYVQDLDGTPWVHQFDCLTFDVLSMSGNDIGPATAPGNLTGTVKFNLGAGCAPFDYGFTNIPNNPPTAAASVKQTTITAGTPATFDGADSYDDITAPSSLQFAWDFNNDGTFEKTGQSVQNTFATAGTYPVTLRVTDSGSKSGSTTMAVTVTAPTPSPSPKPAATKTPAPTKTPKPTPKPPKTPAPRP